MKKITKLLFTFLSVVIIGFSAMSCGSKKDSAQQENTGASTSEKGVAKIGVLLYKFDDTYISTVRQNLEKIQKENSDKVEFTFYNGNGDQATQNDSIDLLLQKGVDMLLVNLVDTGAAQTVINKIKDSGKPVIFFNREPATDVIKSYDKAYFVGTNATEAGVFQGKILTKIWNDDKENVDTNGDGKMQYVMLQGEPDNPEAVARTEYSVSTIKDSGIEVEELAKQVCNWDQSAAQNATEAWVSKFGDKIEVVIANNDGMAQGAIAALQAQGFNNGPGTKTIPVVGVDATVAAQDLINKGYMAGSVLQDAEGMAKALYDGAMNLVNGRSVNEGTKYTLDDTGVAIRIPYQEYTK